MSPGATEQYVDILSQLKPGDLSLLRTHAGQALDESVDGFDLFAGLWWPLRNKNRTAPRREVAWLIAKLYALTPIPHSPGAALANQLAACQPPVERKRLAFQRRFDDTLSLPLGKTEPSLRWALAIIAANRLPVDWVALTNDLSAWERESTRLKWAEEYLEKD